LVSAFVESVHIAGEVNALDAFVCTEHYTEHHPNSVDGFAPLKLRLDSTTSGSEALVYHRLHRVIAQGNFALAVSEGSRAGMRTSFYDLYRVEADKIVEHWDTLEAVAPPDEWKHDNGKF
jgi:predicted SnoaL-like aldol condensation-catalyzing enzyme